MSGGPHVQGLTPAAKEWASRAPCVKALDDPAVLELASPTAILVFRVMANDYDHYLANPDAFVELVDTRLKGFRAPGRLYVELLNELPSNRIEQYVTWALVVVPKLHALGLLVVGPCWGSGDYGPDDWARWRGSNWAGLDAIGVHAYWADLGPTEWNGYRWRKYYMPSKDGDRIFITECGRDHVRDGANGEMIGKGGWLADGLSEDAYLAECVKYVKSLVSPNEWAFFFTSGANDVQKNYNMDSISGRLADQLAQAPVVIPPTPPKPTPKPTPGGNTMPAGERVRYFEDLWKRFGATYTPGFAFSEKWAELMDQNSPLGAPLETEHKSEDKTYLYQMFSSGRCLYATIDKKGNLTSEVLVGFPPLA